MSGRFGAGRGDPGGAQAGAVPLRISVVVPAWRDAENLAILLPALAQLPGLAETVVVDASDDVASEEIARRCGSLFLKHRKPNRGAQMNAGARMTSGDVLLFQHADTVLLAAHLGAIASALREPRIIGGAFYRKFDDRHPRLLRLESFARFLTRRGGTLFGDQSVFVRREVFLHLRGFAEIPLMEDVEFSRRLRAAGKVAVLDPPVQTSARRHKREGAWRKTIQNGSFILLYKLGVSPALLHRWYYRRPSFLQNEQTRTAVIPRQAERAEGPRIG